MLAPAGQKGAGCVGGRGLRPPYTGALIRVRQVRDMVIFKRDWELIGSQKRYVIMLGNLTRQVTETKNLRGAIRYAEKEQRIIKTGEKTNGA